MTELIHVVAVGVEVEVQAISGLEGDNHGREFGSLGRGEFREYSRAPGVAESGQVLLYHGPGGDVGSQTILIATSVSVPDRFRAVQG